MTHEEHSEDSTWVTTFVFIAGLLFGAGTALLLAPESGTSLRTRLARGAKTAQDELAAIAAEAKTTLATLSKEAQEAIKHTTERVTAAVDKTKEAIVTPPLESRSREESNERPNPMG
ncbi:MAG: YtxH domain-containing protein [Nitrospirae bacterium]|nr:MAG: YtxH domain-containing protein [Nitrospirota bacterium]